MAEKKDLWVSAMPRNMKELKTQLLVLLHGENLFQEQNMFLLET